MKFIVDAHLPKRITDIFIELGHEAIHTSDLPKGNASDDKDIISAAGNDSVVISKDEDFYQSFLLFGKPPQLIHVKVGNMRLSELVHLFESISPKLIDLLGQYNLLELYRDKIIVII